MDSILDYEIGAARHQEFLRQAAEAHAHRLPAGESTVRRLLARLLNVEGSKPTATPENHRTATDPLPIRSS